jgi:hypothetical protein
MVGGYWPFGKLSALKLKKNWDIMLGGFWPVGYLSAL